MYAQIRSTTLRSARTRGGGFLVRRDTKVQRLCRSWSAVARQRRLGSQSRKVIVVVSLSECASYREIVSTFRLTHVWHHRGSGVTQRWELFRTLNVHQRLTNERGLLFPRRLDFFGKVTWIVCVAVVIVVVSVLTWMIRYFMSKKFKIMKVYNTLL